MERTKSINEVTVLSELPDLEAKVASLIRINPNGITKDEILSELIPKDGKLADKANKEIIKEIQNSILSLMRQVLIKKKKDGDKETYVVF